MITHLLYKKTIITLPLSEFSHTPGKTRVFKGFGGLGDYY